MKLYLKLSNLFFFRFLKKYSLDNKSTKFLIYSITIFIIMFWFITIPILFIVYLGIVVYRKSYLKKIGNTIRHRTNRTFHKNFYRFIAVILFTIYLFILIMILLMIFTIPIIVLMLIGYFIEKKNIEPKKKKNESYVIKLVNIDNMEKKESKTTEYL